MTEPSVFDLVKERKRLHELLHKIFRCESPEDQGILAPVFNQTCEAMSLVEFAIATRDEETLLKYLHKVSELNMKYCKLSRGLEETLRDAKIIKG